MKYLKILLVGFEIITLPFIANVKISSNMVKKKNQFKSIFFYICTLPKNIKKKIKILFFLFVSTHKKKQKC